ncbi:MAG: NADH-quinone oxidoreductase subunit J [Bacteroidales bacterium]|jgi:NADH-quinone oxidoreductase subunit J|nr:NADH-quinone oxidoreductase subunit J [Bacteroidales bacterium]
MMTGNQVMFFVFSTIIVIFSILTVTSRRILRAAIFLLTVMVSTAGLYFMLNYQFIAAVQLTLYAGGIVALIIFSILLTSHINHRFEPVELKKTAFAALAAVAGVILCITAILGHNFTATPQAEADVNMQLIGKSLLSFEKDGFILPFEVISLLLLAAMIAAIVVAKKDTDSKSQV